MWRERLKKLRDKILSGLRYLLAALFFLSPTIVLIWRMTSSLGPYLEDKDFIPAECTFVGVIDHGTRDYCNTDESGDKSQFPCVGIRVTYHDLDDVERDASISEFNGNDKSCSYWRCGGSTEDRAAKIMSIVTRWNNTRPPFSSPCYINPHNLTQVIEKKRTVDILVLPLLVFAVVFIIGGCFFFCDRPFG